MKLLTGNLLFCLILSALVIKITDVDSAKGDEAGFNDFEEMVAAQSYGPGPIRNRRQKRHKRIKKSSNWPMYSKKPQSEKVKTKSQEEELASQMDKVNIKD